jgi:periplasmic copper chaperone A
MLKRTASLVAALLVVVALAGCGGSLLPDPAGGPMTFKNVWVRPAAAGGMTAAYFDVTNGRTVADAVTGVSVAFADSAGLHETTTDASGMMGMHEVASVPVPAGQTVSFAPGGYHVMLIGLKQDLKAGDRVDLTLTTQGSGSIVVGAEVRDQ